MFCPAVASVAKYKSPVAQVPGLLAVRPDCMPLTVVTVVPLVVTLPDKSVFVTELAPENLARLPLAGEPVVVTVPLPPPATATQAVPLYSHSTLVAAPPTVQSVALFPSVTYPNWPV